MKKICFVVHEFGMFKGHGGIASYIYYLCQAILKRYDNEFEIHVITCMYDEKNELIKNANFVLHAIEARSVEWKGAEICKLLKKIKPLWVETSDYEGLCLEAIIDRNKGAEELRNTAFMVIHHTASKECFEWSYSIHFHNANICMQNIHVREKAQYFLCDKNIFPSNFLLKYIQKNDGVRNSILLRYTYENIYTNRKEMYQKAEKKFDLSFFKDKFVISYISRIEGRKNQKFLIDAYIKFKQESDCDTILIIAGNSLRNEVYGYDERERLYFSIPKEERDSILFYDFVDKEMYKLICSVTTVAIMASVFENFPIAMMEYVYMGIPVMASIYSGCKDYMLGHEKYMAFNPFNVYDLKEKILNFSRLSGNQQHEIAKKQYENLFNLCCEKNSLGQKLDIYQEICELKKQRNSSLCECAVYSCDDLIKIQKEEKYCEYMIIQGIYKRNSCLDFTKKNKYIFENMDENKIVIVGMKTWIHRSLEDALCYDEMIIIRKIHIEAGKRLIQSLNKYFTVNFQNYVYIPFFSAYDVALPNRDNRYVELLNQLFMLREGIDLEMERIDW